MTLRKEDLTVMFLVMSLVSGQLHAKEQGRAPKADIQVLRKQADALSKEGKYREAVARYKQVIEHDTALEPRGNEQIANAWMALGYCYSELDDHLAELDAWYHALGIQIDTYYSGDGRKGDSLFHIGKIAIKDKELPEAKVLLEQIVARAEAWRKGNEAVSYALQSLGRVNGRMGAFKEGIANLNEAIRRQEPSIRSSDPARDHKVNHIIAWFMLDRAKIELKAGLKNEAKQTYSAIVRGLDEMGAADFMIETADALSGLASLAEEEGKDAEARELRDRENRIRRERTAAARPDLPPEGVQRLAEIVQKSQAAQKKIEDATSRGKGAGEEKVISHAPGPVFQQKTVALMMNAVRVAMKGSKTEKIKCAEDLDRASKVEGEKFLRYAIPELRFLRADYSDVLYGLYEQTGNTSAAARLVLRTKGIIVDSLVADRQAIMQAGEPLLSAANEVHQLERQLGKVVLERENQRLKAAENENDLRSALLGKQEFLQQKLADLGPRLITDIDPAKIQAALAADEALVEYVSLSRLDLANSASTAASVTQYGALVFTAQSPTRWVSLGPDRKIDYDVALSQKLVRTPGGDSAALGDVLHSLYRELWAPIEKTLSPEIKRVIISPHKELNFVSWAVLLAGDDHFAAEKYLFRYVSSGRDLLRPIVPHRREATIFSDPVFSTENQTGQTARRDNSGSKDASSGFEELTAMKFPRLPGSAAEAEELANLLKSKQWTVESMSRDQANENKFLQVHSPGILHLGTHGFSLSKQKMDGNELLRMVLERTHPQDAGFFDSPMRRNGFVLSGALESFAEWKKGKTPPLETDGVVTCDEIRALSLEGTWLVSLASCDSAAGERRGFDIEGLRQAFTIAGAQNVLTTLWPVNDSSTARLIADFYRAALESNDPARALAETQRASLLRMRGEKVDLLSTVTIAGPFVMHSQGISIP